MDVLPITIKHVLAPVRVLGPHRDPFDRMLIAQSQIKGLPIVTSDPVLKPDAVEYKKEAKMDIVRRFFQESEQSFFLFGPRGTGKSTWGVPGS